MKSPGKIITLFNFTKGDKRLSILTINFDVQLEVLNNEVNNKNINNI